MELTANRIREYAREYAAREPLYAVEQEHVEILPDTFAGDEYGRRDVEWVVQWYFRRYLGAYPDKRRREREETFRDNDFGTVLDTLSAVAERPAATAGNLRRLTDLDGVGVPVASAFLQFTFPDRYVAVDARLWETLRECDGLDDPYPDPPGVEEYLEFDGACGRLAERFDVTAWTLYRGLWRAWKDREGDGGR
jgi:hypothetical protein